VIVYFHIRHIGTKRKLQRNEPWVSLKVCTGQLTETLTRVVSPGCDLSQALCYETNVLSELVTSGYYLIIVLNCDRPLNIGVVSYINAEICSHGVVLKHRDNFTFSY
jgi:hypothetical protein